MVSVMVSDPMSDSSSKVPVENERDDPEAEAVETEQRDVLVSPERSLDEYVEVMMNLRVGSRPILCW